MAAPAPVQLQRPVMVSDLVCCVFVYVAAIEVKHLFLFKIGIEGGAEI